MSVFVLDRRGKPLMPCSEKRARLLLERGRARVHRMVPFVIRVTDRRANDSVLQSLRLKLDPGSKTTGIALVREKKDAIAVLNLFELAHRGKQISKALTARRQLRRGRRSRNLRHRAPRFLNRGNKDKGWLPPSLMHRVDTTLSWVRKLSRWTPISALSTELVKFDMQLMQNPEISGVEYSQGELAGYEVREYLLEKWHRQCAYCDKQNVPLQVEHIDPRANGGSNRVSNLALACEPCNLKKGSRSIRDFLTRDPARLARIMAQAKAPLRDAAAVNATRHRLLECLKDTGLFVTTGTGGQTKFNRSRLGIPKTHALDAVCVGNVAAVEGWMRPVLNIQCTGRGSYQRTHVTAQGFPRGYLMRSKQVHGFQTGDRVKAVVPQGKNTGTHVGRVAVRASGNFSIKVGTGLVSDVAYRYCTLLQRNDGYGYSQQSTAKAGTSSMPAPRIAVQFVPFFTGGVPRSNF